MPLIGIHGIIVTHGTGIIVMRELCIHTKGERPEALIGKPRCLKNTCILAYVLVHRRLATCSGPQYIICQTEI